MKGMFPEDVVIYIIFGAGFLFMLINNSEKLNAIQSFWNTFAELFSIDRAVRSILKRIFRCILYQDVYEPGRLPPQFFFPKHQGLLRKRSGKDIFRWFRLSPAQALPMMTLSCGLRPE